MSKTPLLEILLVPDSSAARRVRRRLAEEQPRCGVLVATMDDLIGRAARRYHIFESGITDEDFEAVLGNMSDRFWSGSFEVAPAETAAAIKSALTTLVAASDPSDPVNSIVWDAAKCHSERLCERLEHLKELLLGELCGVLPGRQQQLRRLLEHDATRHPPAEMIRVHCVPEQPYLSRWEAALVEKLNTDAGDTRHSDLQGLLTECLVQAPSASKGTALFMLQKYLIGSSEVPKGEKTQAEVRLDDTAQWIRVRDCYQEAEVAAGLVQEFISGSGTEAADVGILVPQGEEYAYAVRRALRYEEIVPSGLPDAGQAPDYGYQLVFNLLHCLPPDGTNRDKSIWWPPVMAQASVLSSPLMPWSIRVGRSMAQRVMEGKREIAASKGILDEIGERAHLVFALLQLRLPCRCAAHGTSCERSGHGTGFGNEVLEALRNDIVRMPPPEILRTLRDWLTLSSKLSPQGRRRRTFGEEWRRALDGLARVEREQTRLGSADWQALARRVAPKPCTVPPQASCWSVEGVTILREGHEPWRTVDHLIVLGFDESRYPRVPSSLPVLTGAEWSDMACSLDLDVDLPVRQLERRRSLFYRQLSAALKSVTFLLPHWGLDGKRKQPSTTLHFMRALFAGSSCKTTGELPELVCSMDDEPDCSREKHSAELIQVESGNPVSRESGGAAAMLDLKMDLLQSGKGRKDPAQSLSRLDTLLVSPLAWLLNQLCALPPQAWKPSDLTVLLKGNIMHAAFASIFKGWTLDPSKRELDRESAEEHFKKAVASLAPFLSLKRWRIEYKQLEEQCLEAADKWHGLLVYLEAKDIQTEFTFPPKDIQTGSTLPSVWNGVDISGRADLIVSVGSDRRLVVDYKSGSLRNLETRMKSGYELQASLYAELLKSSKALGMTDATKVAVAYYSMSKHDCCSDMSFHRGAIADAPLTWTEIQSKTATSISEHAKNVLRKQLDDVTQGRICLVYCEKFGLPRYALDSSPLVRQFCKEVQA